MTIFRILHEQLLHPYHLNECRVSCLVIDQLERTFVGILFGKVLSISIVLSVPFTEISIETASSIFTANTSGQRRILTSFESSGFLPVGTPEIHCVCSSC
jgi:hypothetical protein